MASKATPTRSSSVEQSGEELQQIEEEITCAICGNLFNDPKTIPCLHTFCKSCLERSIESNKKMATEVCCPLCRAPLLRDETKSIPTNFTIKRLVEIVRSKKEDNVECENCRIRLNSISKTKKPGDEVDLEPVAPAVFWCVQCAKCMCEKCHDAHKQWGEFVEHKCVAIEEITTSSMQESKSVSTSRSSTRLEWLEMCRHHSKPLDFYCRTCKCLICYYCTAKDHRDHNFEDKLTEVADEEREKVKHATAPLEELLDQVRKAVKELEDTEKQIDVRDEANVKKIQATYDEVHQLLKRQEEEAINKANTITRLCKKRLTTQKENATFLESELAACDEFRIDILAADRTRKLLSYNNDWIMNRVDQLKIQVANSNFAPDCTATDMTAKHRKPIEFINNLGFEQFDIPCLSNCSFSRYGHIVKLVHPESPNLFTLKGATHMLNPFKETAKTDQVKVTVILNDAFGFPVVRQSSHLKIRCNKDEDFLHNVCVEEHSNGRYSICYSPKINENHYLQIYWNGNLLSHENVKVLMTVRDYNNVGQAVKTIEKYGPNNAQLIEPNLLAKGPNDELIVCDHSTKQLVVFDKQFQYSHVIGGAGRGNGKFQRVTGIAVDRNGYLYAADCTLHCIQKFNLSGEFISQFSSGEGSTPFGLVLSQSDQLFICDSSNDKILVFQYENFAYGFGQHGTEPGYFNHPQDLALSNSEDQLFITDHRNDRVQVFTPYGQFLRYFDRFTNVMFRLKSPFGINCTPDGHLLASSQDSNCILVFKEDGNFVRAIESMSRGKKRFSDPRGVLIMDEGQIVIADKSNNRLIVF